MQTDLDKLRTVVAASVVKAAKTRETAEQNLRKAKQEYDAAHVEHTTATKLLAAFPVVQPEVKAKGKPGPKAKAAAPKAAVAKAKPGPKAKVKVKAAAPKAAPKAKAAAATKKTRQKADGSMTMIESLCAVIGNKVIHIDDVVQGLKDRKVATTSKDLKSYVSAVMSAAKDKSGNRIFEAVERGKYCVVANRKDAPKAAPKAPKAAAAPKAPKAAVAVPKAVAAPKAPVAAAPEVTSGQSPADQLITDMGMDPSAFGGASAPLS